MPQIRQVLFAPKPFGGERVLIGAVLRLADGSLRTIESPRVPDLGDQQRAHFIWARKLLSQFKDFDEVPEVFGPQVLLSEPLVFSSGSPPEEFITFAKKFLFEEPERGLPEGWGWMKDGAGAWSEVQRNEAVLSYLTDAVHEAAPYPDDRTLHPEDSEAVAVFRATHGRWPVWWEMADMMRNHEARGEVEGLQEEKGLAEIDGQGRLERALVLLDQEENETREKLCRALRVRRTASYEVMLHAVSRLNAEIHDAKEVLAPWCPECDPSRCSLQTVVSLLVSDTLRPMTDRVEITAQSEGGITQRATIDSGKATDSEEARRLVNELNSLTETVRYVVEVLKDDGNFFTSEDNIGPSVEAALFELSRLREEKKMGEWPSPQVPTRTNSDRQDHRACYRDPYAYWAALRLTKKILGDSVISHPDVRSGRPVIKGTHFLVSQVIAELAGNERLTDIADEYDLELNKLEGLLFALSMILDQIPQDQ